MKLIFLRNKTCFYEEKLTSFYLTSSDSAAMAKWPEPLVNRFKRLHIIIWTHIVHLCSRKSFSVYFYLFYVNIGLKHTCVLAKFGMINVTFSGRMMIFKPCLFLILTSRDLPSPPGSPYYSLENCGQRKLVLSRLTRALMGSSDTEVPPPPWPQPSHCDKSILRWNRVCSQVVGLVSAPHVKLVSLQPRMNP